MKIWNLFFASTLLFLSSLTFADEMSDAVAAYRNKNYVEAFQLFKPLAESGKEVAQGYLGFMFAAGEGVGKNEKEALAWTQRAADKGHARSQAILGSVYKYGLLGVAKNDKESLKWYRLAEEKDDAAALFNLGLSYGEGSLGLEKNGKTAVSYLQKAAIKGELMAQTILGLVYADGLWGLEKNEKEALKWIRKAAENGDPTAQRRLGVAYQFGQYDVWKSEKEAAKWYRLAADQGDADAQYYLGDFYLQGISVEKDREEAFKLFKMAATQGHVKAQTQIGSMYELGRGVSENYYEALKWYRLAAAQGDAKAQRGIGDLYRSENWDLQNFSKADIWCSIAALNSQKDGVGCRDFSRLSADEISRAWVIVSNCQKNNFKNCLDITPEESAGCAQLVEINKDKGTERLLGKPLFSYSKEKLTAMNKALAYCDSIIDDGKGPLHSALLTLGELTVAYDANAAKVAEAERIRVAEEKRKEEEAKRKEEEAKKAAYIGDLQSGRRQPQNFREWVIASSAVDGMNLASAPKVRPDGKSYALMGVIDSAGEKPEFMASNGVEGLRTLGYKNIDHTYFYVKIPKPLQNRYYDTGKIGMWFKLVGRYVANGTYRTVAGQEKSMPVFEAIYWEPSDVIGDSIRGQMRELLEAGSR